MTLNEVLKNTNYDVPVQIANSDPAYLHLIPCSNLPP